jgi:nucleoid-associated protein YgaU
MTTVHRTRRHHVAVRGVAPVPATPPARRSGARPGAGAPRRRRLAGLVAAGALSLLGLGAHGVLSGPGDVPASAAGAGPDPASRTVKVHAGDTLWSIAERHHGHVAIQRYVDALVDLNGGSTEIAAGQLVHLP